ncbi:Uncharacterised protein [Enterobacter ludwigii]|nr:Uncharacterised protein [Enterobacter ludwigii]
MRIAVRPHQRRDVHMVTAHLPGHIPQYGKAGHHIERFRHHRLRHHPQRERHYESRTFHRFPLR